MSVQWLRQSVRLFTLLSLILSTLLGTLPAHAQAEIHSPGNTVAGIGASTDSAGLPSTAFDLPSTPWMSIRGYTSAEHQQFFDDVDKNAFMAIDVEGYDLKGAHRYGSVWQTNPDSRSWLMRRNMTLAEFNALFSEQRDLGNRLIDQDVYTFDGKTYYSAIWMKNVEALDWISYLNVTEADHEVFFKRYSAVDMIPIDIEVFPTAAGLRYSVIWVKNVEGLNWVMLRDMSSAGYAAKFDEYAPVYRVHDIESYMQSGKQLYAAIWYQNVNGRGWAAYRDMSAQGYSNRWNELRDAGYRLTDFEAYPTAEGLRYAGVWRQNSDRPVWRLREPVDALGQSFVDSNQAAGLSIAIARGGQFRYLRGFGMADIAANKTAHSQTIYRLASASKAVAGTLTMRMVEDGVFALNDNTRDYFPALPVAHTHTIQQTVSNRAGVRHYAGGADPTDPANNPAQFNTAQDAAALFSLDPLLFVPGTGYSYSTHAYTLLGGAMEGAVGDPIAQIVEDRITVPFGTPSLRAEDRSVYHPYRAALYTGNAGPVEVAADNISWKVLGGGLESSAYDLARMGMQLVDESMLSADSLNAMWTRPNNLSDFALGWNTGTDQGYQVVARVGAQTGTYAYIRMYPELDIVIVVITNHRFTDNNNPLRIVQLGRDIGTLMLDNLDIAALEPGPSTQMTTDQAASYSVAPASATGLIKKVQSSSDLDVFALDPHREVGDFDAEADPVERPAINEQDPFVEPSDGDQVPGAPVVPPLYLPALAR